MVNIVMTEVVFCENDRTYLIEPAQTVQASVSNLLRLKVYNSGLLIMTYLSEIQQITHNIILFAPHFIYIKEG